MCLISKLRYGLTRTFLLTLSVVLSGCHDADLAALQHEIEAMGRASAVVEKPVTTTSFPPDTVAGHLFDDDRRSPFEPPGQLSAPAMVPRPGLPPDGQTPAGPLQTFTLDELVLVGTLTFDGRSSALVRDPAGKLHRVSIGTRLGADFGRVTEITASAVQLLETVPAASGWEKRVSTMALKD